MSLWVTILFDTDNILTILHGTLNITPQGSSPQAEVITPCLYSVYQTCPVSYFINDTFPTYPSSLSSLGQVPRPTPVYLSCQCGPGVDMVGK